MELFLTYKNFSADATFTGGGAADIDDYQTIIGGARVSF